MTKHPAESDLALLAGGESGRIQRFLSEWHVRNCADCQEKIAGFHDLRRELAETELPDLNWDFLAMEMRANIRLGLEAGACVGPARVAVNWYPRLTAAVATLLVLVGLGLFFASPGLRRAEPAASILQATSSGIELRSGTDSFSLVDAKHARSDQTVSAKGAIQALYIEKGGVTINNVYLQ